MPEQTSPSLHRLALATSGATIVLLMAGALVTSNDAADSVPDWPLAYHKIIPPLIGGIRYEFAHRVVAAIVAILTTVLVVWLARSAARSAVKTLGWVAFALVLAQAGLGALRVLFHHPAVIATVHATVAQVFFLTTVALAYHTGAGAEPAVSSVEDTSTPRLSSLCLWTTAVILVQLVLGAGFRHGAFGILPHLIGAVVVTVMVIWTGRVAKARFRNLPEIRRSVARLHASFGTQILLGFGAYWAVSKAATAVQPTPLYVALTVAHVVVGALVLASSITLSLSSMRLTGPAGERAIAASGTQAAAPAEGARI